MKIKTKKLLTVLLAFTMVISLIAAMPLTASAEDGPFQVRENPAGAIYMLNQTAVPIRAIFEYDALADALADFGTIDSVTPIKVQWYWSNTNSNTGRSNGQGESEIPYSRKIVYTTTLTPATDTAGVRYYYAVITYNASIQVALGSWESVPRETVTEPARIEVIDPNEPVEQSFQVRKVDDNGNLLAGAVFSLVPDEAYTWGEKKSYEATSGTNGTATFTVTEGAYILSEKQAPSGYIASDETHFIWVDAEQVMEVVDYRTQNYKSYETIFFVNKPIPTLKKDDHFAYMVGYPEGTFLPSRNMTRAEAVVMFSRLLEEGIKLDGNYINDHYPDVTTGWYANAVCYMQSLGVLTDYSRDERFRPNEPVTRAEFATLATHFEDLTLTDTNIFSDVPNDHWAVKYINSAAAKGWIVGYDEGGVKNFKPEGNITRAEVVTLVNRMLERKGDGAYLAANLSSLPRTFSDLAPTHWAYLDIMESAIGHDYIKNGDVESWTGVYE